MGHVAGFFSTTPSGAGGALRAASPPLLAAYGVAAAATYAMAVAERKDFLLLHRLVRLASVGEWDRFLERAPRWLLTAPVTVLTGMMLPLTARAAEPGAAGSVGWFVLASICFMTRDLGIMLFCNLGKSTRRADMLTVLYLALLYGVFPAIFSAMRLETATQFFWPRPDLHPLTGCVAPLLEVLAIVWLAAGRWRTRLAETGK
jgi:hypothetical protein